jgi:cell division protein FtsZ
MGYAIMGTAAAAGEHASIEAAQRAINSPLMEEGGILGGRGVLINITASSHLSIHDVNEACNLIRDATHNDDVQINFGVVMDESMNDQVKITVIATGFQRDSLPEIGRNSSNSSSFFDQPSSRMAGEQEAEPAAAGSDQESSEDGNDVDTPAYLRKKRALVS